MRSCINGGQIRGLSVPGSRSRLQIFLSRAVGDSADPVNGDQPALCLGTFDQLAGCGFVQGDAISFAVFELRNKTEFTDRLPFVECLAAGVVGALKSGVNSCH